MPVCENCRQEGVDFYEDGGLFYCGACDTQSQVMRVFENDEDYPYQSLTSFSHSYKTAKKKPTEKNEAEEKDSDSKQDISWWSSEIYQAVLKAQVKALIKNGFPSRLDDIVLQLWIRFLRKSGAAFCDSSEVSNAAGAHMEESDEKEKAEQTQENNQEDQTSPEPKKKKLKYGHIKKVYSKDDFMHRSLKRKKVIKGASKDKQEKRVQLLIWDSVCFMYLALHILDEPVLLSDMIRWVREGHLPLKATPDVLPEHIARNLNLKDIMRFCSPVTFIHDVGYLNDCLQRVATGLDIPRPLNQQDVSFVIARMVYTLNLPVELCQLAYQISTQVQHSERKQKTCDFSLERPALSYIVVALKLLFTLDDRTEHVMSHQTRCLQSLFTRVRLFNWDTWVEAQKLRIQEKFYREGTASDSSDLNRPFGMDGFVHHFNSMYQVEQVNKYMYIKEGQRKRRQTTLKDYQRPFRALGRDSSISPTSPSSASMQGSVTTVPLPNRQPNSESTSKNGESISVSEVDFDWLPRQYLNKEDFSKHTLKHLTNLQELGEQYIVSPQDVSKVLDLAESRSCSSENSAFKPERKRSRRKTDSCDANKSEKKGKKGEEKQKVSSKKSQKGIDKNHQENSSGSSESETETSERPKLSRLDRRANTYFLYPQMTSRYAKRTEAPSVCFHTSWAWLLEHLCNIFEMKTYFLARFVSNTEKVLFKVQPDA